MKRSLLAFAFVFGYFAAPSAQTPLEAVREARAKYPPMLDPADAPAMLRDAAILLAKSQGGSWGLLIKTAGNQCGGYSCDCVCDGQYVLDVLIDGPDGAAGQPGRAEPTWPGNPKADPLNGRTCDLVILGQPKPDGGGGFDPGPLYAEIDALKARLADLEAQWRNGQATDAAWVKDLADTIAGFDARLKALEARPLPEVKPFPCVIGKLWGTFPIRSCPEVKP